MYSRRDYDGHAQNWGLAIAPDGVLLVANGSGLLEFDGATWRTTPIGSTVRSIAVDPGPSGRVWAGAKDDLGYFDRDRHGRYHFVSLLQHLPPPARPIGDVWQVFATADGPVFATERAILLWRDEQFTALFGFGGLHKSMWCDGQLFVREKGRGLMVLRRERLEPVAGGELFAEDKVYAMVAAAPGVILVASRKHGLTRLTEGGFSRVDSAANKLLAEHLVYNGARLADGTLIFGTLRGGLVRTLADGQLAQVVDGRHGLPEKMVLSLLPGPAGLWLGLNDGLALVQLPSRLSRYSSAAGLRGNAYDVIDVGSTLLVGTSQGLFYSRPITATAVRFDGVAPVNLQVWSLAQQGEHVLAASSAGLFAVSLAETASGTVVRDLQKATGAPTFAVAVSAQREDVAFVATREAIVRARTAASGRFALERGRVLSTDRPVRRIVEATPGRVWLAAASDEVIGLHFVGGPLSTPDVIRVGPEQGLPKSRPDCFVLNGEALFSTAAGLYRWSRAERRLQRDAELSDLLGFGDRGSFSIAEDGRGAVWVSARSGPAVFARKRGETDLSAALERRSTELATLHDERLYAIRTRVGPGPPTAWFGGVGGVVQFVDIPLDPPPKPITVLIRAIRRVRGDALPLPADVPPVLDHSEASIRFDFAAPSFADGAAVRYRHRLTGREQGWSSWSVDTHATWTDLREGAFDFAVQARDAQGVVSLPARYPFTVLPPWYRTTLARLFAILLALIAVGGLTRAWTWRLKRQNTRLEATVAERTAQLRTQATEMERQHQELEREHAENERLLLSILPAAIASRMRAGEENIVDSFDNISVLFADLVGFTELSNNVDSSALVEMLNALFSVFDGLSRSHGVEKIKTIGDAYMAVAGLPRPRPDHADAAVRLALELIEATERFNRERGTHLRLRVGVNSGPVVAGVIGTNKFAYDLWGNTVNVASRMESHGVAGRVQISAATRAALVGGWRLDERGPIEIKGKGAMDTWLVGSASET